ncbi:MAG: hypothetical protein KC583_12950, partial [Myxococcales bacterium]|nr:hypothetical protein [Myxococcales bacterium]
MRRALLLSLLAVLVTGLGPARAEGGAELPGHVLLSATDLRVDILAPDRERIAWQGTGLLEVRTPDGAPLGFVAPGDSVGVPAGQPGAYRLSVTEDQPDAWSIEVDGADDAGGRLWSRQWLLRGAGATPADALNTSLFVRRALADGDVVVEIRLRGWVGLAFQLGALADGPDAAVPGGFGLVPDLPIYLRPPTATRPPAAPPAPGALE